MTTIKAFTDLEQSKKLAEIFPLESADMVFISYTNLKTNTVEYDYPSVNIDGIEELDILCWSLAALLDILNCSFLEEEKGRWYCTGNIHGIIFMHGGDDNAVDACVTAIIKLKEDDLI